MKFKKKLDIPLSGVTAHDSKTSYHCQNECLKPSQVSLSKTIFIGQTMPTLELAVFMYIYCS